MKKTELEKNKIRISDIGFVVATLLTTFASMFLFYMQSIRYNGGYVSDTYLYVNMSKEQHGVRLITWIFNYLYKLGNNTIPIAIYMGIVIAGIIIMNYALMKLYCQNDGFSKNNRIPQQCCAILMLFTGSMYIPVIHEHFYKESWCTFAWHSPTQQLMILCALVTLYFFEKIYENYMERIAPSHWIALLIASTISVWAKPSFMLIFIPTLIIVFVIELIKHAKEGSVWHRFVRLFIFGLSMVPSGILILLLNDSIYGEKSENSVEMGLSHLLNSEYNIGIAALCGLMFPLIVFVANHKRFKEMRFQVALGMLFMGILEWAIFFEVGTRGEHGNFGWGRQIGCYYAFLIAMVLLIENYNDKEFMNGESKKRKAYFIIAILILFVHVVTQLYHFYLMGKGHTYYL